MRQSRCRPMVVVHNACVTIVKKNIEINTWKLTISARNVAKCVVMSLFISILVTKMTRCVATSHFLWVVNCGICLTGAFSPTVD